MANNVKHTVVTRTKKEGEGRKEGKRGRGKGGKKGRKGRREEEGKKKEEKRNKEKRDQQTHQDASQDHLYEQSYSIITTKSTIYTIEVAK